MIRACHQPTDFLFNVAGVRHRYAIMFHVYLDVIISLGFWAKKLAVSSNLHCLWFDVFAGCWSLFPILAHLNHRIYRPRSDPSGIWYQCLYQGIAGSMGTTLSLSDHCIHRDVDTIIISAAIGRYLVLLG